MHILEPKVEGTCRRCSHNTENNFIAISRYHDGGIIVDTYCERCLPLGKAVLPEGADSTTVYDVYKPGHAVYRTEYPKY